MREILVLGVKLEQLERELESMGGFLGGNPATVYALNRDIASLRDRIDGISRAVADNRTTNRANFFFMAALLVTIWVAMFV